MSSFITTDATQDVFELVLARPVMTLGGEHPCLVHLWWRAPDQEQRLVQIYVNESLYDVTQNASVRETFLVLDRTRPTRIELLAVPVDDPESIWRSQPNLLKSWQPMVNSKAEAEVIRDENLPEDVIVEVEIDGAVIDAGPMWPVTEARSGVYDANGPIFSENYGLGLGIGDLGVGPLGYDGMVWRWRRNDLDQGTHDLQCTALSLTGEPASLPVSLVQSIEHLPNPVTGLRIDAPTRLTWDT